MLNAMRFDQWCARNNIQEKTRAEIERIRSSQPSRRVGSTTKNVSGRYPSRKMGVTIQFESHRVELPKILELEHDTEVFEFYDQPPSLKLTYSKEGRTMGYIYTSDFFVIREDGAGWVECKTDEELEKLTARSPYRYSKDDQGVWHMFPGEEYAAKLGLSFDVYPSSRINRVFHRNVIFLEDYYRMEDRIVPNAAAQSIISAVSESPGITLEKLLTFSEDAAADDIYIMIARELIFVDFYTIPIGEPDRVRVYPTEDIARIYSRVGTVETSIVSGLKYVRLKMGDQTCWDGKPWTVINIGEKNTYLKAGGSDEAIITIANNRLDEMVRNGEISVSSNAGIHDADNPALALLKKTAPLDHEKAIARLKAVTAYLNGVQLPDSCTKSLRTVQRWTAGYRTAQALYGDGYVGLLPKTCDMGSEGRKISADVLDEIYEFIEKEYETYKQLKKMEVYGKLLLRLEAKGLPDVSYKTFIKELKNRPKYEQTKARRGERAANEHEFFWRLGQDTPKHGDRPFEIAHLDHTEADVELVTSEGINLGRPWLTFMIDAFTRLVLAFFVSFDPPSYRSCMAALRQCVQRFNRLPQTIVVDGGSDFKSIYFEALLARYEVTKKTRPATKARFGGVLERLFGTTNTQFIHTLEGNTQITREVRHVTKLNNPKNLAVWTLNDFIESLSTFVDRYGIRRHSTLGQSPREAFESGVERTGIRPNRVIVYDEAFRIFTLPSTPKGAAKVIPRLGVKIKNIYYWSDMFRSPQLEGSDVPVRYDPFNVGTAYAYINNQWVTCISEYFDKLKNMTEKELQVRSEIIRKRSSSTTKGMRISAKDLAYLHVDNDNKEKLLKQQIKDSELRKTVILQDVTALSHCAPALTVEVENGNHDAVDIDPKQFASCGEY